MRRLKLRKAKWPQPYGTMWAELKFVIFVCLLLAPCCPIILLLMLFFHPENLSCLFCSYLNLSHYLRPSGFLLLWISLIILFVSLIWYLSDMTLFKLLLSSLHPEIAKTYLPIFLQLPYCLASHSGNKM